MDGQKLSSGHCIKVEKVFGGSRILRRSVFRLGARSRERKLFTVHTSRTSRSSTFALSYRAQPAEVCLVFIVRSSIRVPARVREARSRSAKYVLAKVFVEASGFEAAFPIPAVANKDLKLVHASSRPVNSLSELLRSR